MHRNRASMIGSRGLLVSLFALPLLLAPATATAQQNLFVSVIGSGSIVELAGGTGAPTNYATGLGNPIGLAFDSNGNLFVGAESNGSLVELPPGNPGGGAGTVVGGPGIFYTYGVAVDPSNNVYVATQDPVVLKFTPPTTGTAYTQSTFISSTGANNAYGLTFDSSGNLWVGIPGPTAGSGVINEYSPTGTLITTFATGLYSPFGMAFNAQGDLFVADFGNHAGTTIYEFPPNYVSGSPLPVFASGLDVPFGVAVNASGDVFESNFGDGSINEYSPTGTLMATVATGLNQPSFMTFSAVPAATGSAWTGAADMTWANAGNWTGAVPGSTTGTTNSDTALFNQAATNSPLTIDMGRNIQNITFDTANVGSLVIGTTGGNPLLLTAGGTIQTTASVVNPQTINAPLVLEGNYTFSSNATTMSATLTFGGGITPAATSGTTTLTLTGSNTGPNTIAGALADNGSGKLAVAVGGSSVWVFSGAAKTYSGGTTIVAGATLELAGSTSQLSSAMNVGNSGSLMVAAGAAAQTVGTVIGGTAASPQGSLAVSAGTSLTAYQIVQNSLTIHGTGTTAATSGMVTLMPSGSGSAENPTGPNNTNFSSTLASLSIDNNGGTLLTGARVYYGALDIGNNGLVIAYGSGADPYTSIDDMIRSGFDNAHWDGAGITSSLARAAASSNTPLNIGLVDFTPGKNGDKTFTVFEGQTITTNAILLRLTYMDDLNLFGDMSPQDAASDALLFAANYGAGTTWNTGDLTHQGLIDTTDALYFAANYATGLASLDGTTGSAAMFGGSTTAVPEPASMALAAIGALVFWRLARRRDAEFAGCTG